MSIRNLAHTPGPWKVADTNNDMTCVYSEDTNIALLVHKNDAILIAAAPEMLETLKNIANRSNCINDPLVASDVHNLAKMTISKIERG